ncbi:hypothetical protein LTR04_004772, partial [Oleoguttula sp. CCFEE 6159]
VQEPWGTFSLRRPCRPAPPSRPALLPVRPRADSRWTVRCGSASCTSGWGVLRREMDLRRSHGRRFRHHLPHLLPSLHQELLVLRLGLRPL